jgi:hypothetical protein
MIDASEDERILARARAHREIKPDFVPTERVLQQVAAAEGIDYVTALLYDHVVHSPEHGPFVAAIDELRQESAPTQLAGDTLLAVAPGAFYLEYPHSGADGKLLREQARRLGLSSELIPCDSMGGVEENGRVVCEWLSARTDRKIVLASVSKGGADIKVALRRAEARQAFRNVVAWISLCGILDGSPAVDSLVRRKSLAWLYRTLFWWRGLRFQVLTDLRRTAGGPLDFPLDLPPHIRLIQIVGFPLQHHLTNRLARTCHARCAGLGPNDGAVLLSDVVRTPGLIYPIWGADHYLRPGWELRSLGAAVLRFILQDPIFSQPKQLAKATSE